MAQLSPRGCFTRSCPNCPSDPLPHVYSCPACISPGHGSPNASFFSRTGEAGSPAPAVEGEVGDRATDAILFTRTHNPAAINTLSQHNFSRAHPLSSRARSSPERTSCSKESTNTNTESETVTHAGGCCFQIKRNNDEYSIVVHSRLFARAWVVVTD